MSPRCTLFEKPDIVAEVAKNPFVLNAWILPIKTFHALDLRSPNFLKPRPLMTSDIAGILLAFPFHEIKDRLAFAIKVRQRIFVPRV